MVIAASGELDVEHNTGSAPDAILDGVKVTNNDSAGTQGINIGTSSTATLLVDDGTAIDGGTMVIAASGELDVEHNTGSAPDAILDGVKVTNNDSAGTGINIGSNATLKLDDGTAIDGGTMVIAASGELDVEHNTGTGADAILDGVKVTNNDSAGTGINIGSNATLKLDDGTAIDGGTMVIAASGELDVEHNTGSAPDAILDGVKVTNNDSAGTGINIGSNATLKLDDGTAIDGGTMVIAASGELDVEHNTGSAPDAILDGVKVTNNASTVTARHHRRHQQRGDAAARRRHHD